jgi:hypothetical protein
MKQIIADAKKRRQLLRAEFKALKITISEFAEIHKITPARMGQLLNKRDR